MAKTKTIKPNDITKTGPQTWRSLQQQNEQAYNPVIVEGLSRLMAPTTSLFDINENMEHDVQSSLFTSDNGHGFEDFWGNSIYDEQYADEETFQNRLGDVRAENEPWYAKLGAGIGKGVVLAGTTFLDGTVGLLYGMGSAIANIGNENETGWQTFSRLWDNEVSNGLQQINQFAENYMPNYQTQAEKDAPWYKNLGTVNFWADGVLKNLGFMVGAYYSGAAWTKGLKLAKILGETSTMGARIAGSTLSATNEARVEANQNSADLKKLEYQKLYDAYQQEYNEIMNSNLSIAAGESGISPKKQALDNLEAKYKDLRARVDDNVAKAGAVDFFSNLPLLAFDDFMTYGRLYSRGFSNARDIAKQVGKEGTQQGGWFSRLRQAGKEGLKQEAADASRIAMEEGKYVAKKITAKETWGNIIKTGIREGNEEMAQQMAANFAGNLYTTDGPDAYYQALKNPDAEVKTNDFMTSLTKAFSDSYGSGDQWEQFAVGAISSLIGMPTFGKVNNSDNNTYLGKGKSIGLSGGLFGEFANASAINRESEANVSTMNKVVDRLQQQKRHYVQANSFTDAMDGFSEEGDKFEYKNAEDNLDFSSIQAFSNAGRLDDLRAMVSQDFEGIDDSELEKIAQFTSKNDKDGNPIGGWRNADGTLMSDTEEGRAQMRQELEQKKQDTLKKIDQYAKAIQTVRAIGNNSLTDEQNQELAWLLWKQDQFSDRFNSIKNQNRETFTDFISALDNWEQALTEERPYLTEDTKKDENGEWVADEEGANTKILRQNTNMLSNIRAVKSLMNQIMASKSPLLLASYLKDNPEFSKLLRSEDFFDFVEAMSYKSGMDYATYNQAMQDLIDAERLSKAAEEFNQRYKEFTSDPMSVIAGRQDIERRNEAQKTAKDNIDKKDSVNDATVSDLVQQAEQGTDLDDLASMFDGEMPPSPEEAAEWQQQQQTGKQKVEEAKKIVDTKGKTQTQLAQLLADGKITQQQYDDAIALLNQSANVSQSVDEFTDLQSFAFNDGSILDMGTVDATQLSAQDINDFQDQRVQEAKNALAEAMSAVGESNASTDNLPKEGEVKFTSEQGSNEVKQTGHDSTDKGKSENEKKKQEEQKKAAEKASVATGVQALQTAILNDIHSQLPQIPVSTFANDVSNIATELDKLRAQGVDAIAAIHAIQNTAPMQRLQQTVPNLSQIQQTIVTWWNTKDVAKAGQEEDTISEEQVMAEDNGQTANMAEMSQVQQLANSVNSQEMGPLQYWKPTTTEVPINWTNGDQIPYYVVAEKATNADGSPRYTKAQLRRMEAVYKYLKEKNAWNNAFNIKAGDEVEFVIDEDLNKYAGEPVILMSVNGQIVGDVMSSNDPTFSRQTGLAEFTQRVLDEYNKWKKSNTGLFKSKESSKVAKKMVGKVPFTDNSQRITLNEIHTISTSDGQSKTVPFKLGINVGGRGIIMSPGKTKENRTREDDSIISPLNTKAGTPYLLMPTGNDKRAYMPVPFTMVRYGAMSSGTRLDNAVSEVLHKLETLKRGQEVKWIQELQELLCIPKMHLNFTDDGTIKLTMTPVGEKHQITLYSGPINNPDMFKTIQNGLTNTPFQISRKYINTTFKDGSDYNTMIGELARTNLPEGATHTINTWFTIAPLNAQGQQEKAKSPKSIKENPHSRSSQYTEWVHRYSNNASMILKVDNTTYDVIKPDGKKATGAKAAVYQARTYILNNNITIPENGLVDTPWGTFDVTKEVFTASKPKPTITTPSGSDVANGKPKYTFGEDGKVAKVPAGTYGEEPATLEERVNIDSSLGGLGSDTRFGKKDKNNPVWYYGGDARSTLGKAGLQRGNHYIPSRVVDGKTYPAVITFFANHEQSSFDRNDGMAIYLWRNLTPEEAKTIQDFLWNSSTSDWSYPTIAEFVDDVMHNRTPKLSISSSRQAKSQELSEVEKMFAPYCEGGGRWITDDYPNVDEALAKKFENYWMGNGEFTNDDAKRALEQAKTKAPSAPVESGKTEEELNKEAKSKGLLALNAHKTLWGNLSKEDKELILSLPAIKAKSVMNTASRNFDQKTKTFKGNFSIKDAINPTRNSEVEGRAKPIDMDKEKAWLKKVLPNLSDGDSVRVVEGLISIANSPNSAKAWGQFKQGIIYISNQAARGTMYHEAFHSVVHTLMTDDEIGTLFTEAASKHGDMDEIALEEHLAEDFRKYVQLEETPVLGSAVKLFRTIKHVISSLFGKEAYLDNLFYRINRGQFANRERLYTDYSAYMSQRGLESYNQELDYLRLDVKAIQAEINRAKNIGKLFSQMKDDPNARLTYRGKETLYGGISFAWESEARHYAEGSKYSPLLYVGEDHGRFYIYAKRKTQIDQEKPTILAQLESSLKEAQKKVDEMQAYITNNKWALASRDLMRDNDSYYRKVDQYYSDKMELGNLNGETKQYLQDRGITPEEYNNMTNSEREVLLHCMV